MIVSTRYAAATAVLVALALVPTAIHGYLGYRVDDGLRASGVPAVLETLASRPGTRNEGWMRRNFGTSDGIDRWYGDGERLRLSVVRTYDPKAVYHHPELALSYRDAQFDPGERSALPRRPEVPVTVLHGLDRSGDLVVYALHYGDQFVGNPVAFQLKLAASLLVRGRRPMTLFYVHDHAPAPTSDLAQQPAMRLLEAAIDGFFAQASAASGR